MDGDREGLRERAELEVEAVGQRVEAVGGDGHVLGERARAPARRAAHASSRGGSSRCGRRRTPGSCAAAPPPRAGRSRSRSRPRPVRRSRRRTRGPAGRSARKGTRRGSSAGLYRRRRTRARAPAPRPAPGDGTSVSRTSIVSFPVRKAAVIWGISGDILAEEVSTLIAVLPAFVLSKGPRACPHERLLHPGFLRETKWCRARRWSSFRMTDALLVRELRVSSVPCAR